MNDIIKQMIDGYISAFDAYEIKSPALSSAVQDWKTRILQLSSSVSDPMAFYPKFAESGLQEEYSALISSVAMASMETANEEGAVTADSQQATTKLPTVKEFVEQYRVSYNEVKRSGYRKRGAAAYEAIFDFENKTVDLL